MDQGEGWRGVLSDALSARVISSLSLSGGDINEAHRVELSDGRRVFVKVNSRAPPRFFEAEAEGLEFLREGLRGTRGLLVPEVLHVGEQFLALQELKPVERGDASLLGEGIALLHRAEAGSWGGRRPNFIGTLGQLNETRDSWSEFFIDQRLRVQLALPGVRRLLNPGVQRAAAELLKSLPERLKTGDPPSRLHGDLWGGNYFYVEEGAAIFDPAAYVGHREVDLAMMRLFGGFDEAVFTAYQAVYPLGARAEERLLIYQLYPLLVHVNLFGAAYVGSLERALRGLTSKS